jgi:hypothetical protein
MEKPGKFCIPITAVALVMFHFVRKEQVPIRYSSFMSLKKHAQVQRCSLGELTASLFQANPD